uniref:Uncharacterized protein n=1 Tax=viral metagenome TaxID=1070528 RepID=A0A2V0R9E1_9ZZZZ
MNQAMIDSLANSKKIELRVDDYDTHHSARFLVTSKEDVVATWPLTLTRRELAEMVESLTVFGKARGIQVDVYLSQKAVPGFGGGK